MSKQSPSLESELIATLNTKVAALEKENASLRSVEANLLNIIEHSPNPIITVKPSGLIDIVNAQACELFGYEAHELSGKPVEVLLPMAMRSSHKAMRQGYVDQPTPRYMGVGRDLQGRHKNGSQIDIEVAIAPLKDQEGKVTSVIATIVDIRQRVGAERLLAKQVSDLERINEELDSFAYVASHDLKSPLNAIQKIAGWLKEDCNELLPEESKGHLSLLNQRVERLMTLLNDLLSYSRAGRVDYGAELCDVGQMAEDCLALIDPSNRFELKVEAEKAWLPKVPLQTVLNNLIGNAVKHHNKDQGVIVVRCALVQGNYLVTVSDDGPGIESHLVDKALAMFQTLKPRDQVEGSGMGLALVKKIVGHYGGYLNVGSNAQGGLLVETFWPYCSADSAQL
ncbi:MAG: sensor histidine kinase [Pontibacterium sp.]